MSAKGPEPPHPAGRQRAADLELCYSNTISHAQAPEHMGTWTEPSGELGLRPMRRGSSALSVSACVCAAAEFDCQEGKSASWHRGDRGTEM